MRIVLIAMFLMLLNCSSGANDIQDNKYDGATDRDQTMSEVNSKNAGAWKGFNQLYFAIQAEKNKTTLETHYDNIEDWKIDHSQTETFVGNGELLSSLVFILNDEVKRKKEHLRNKPGRQPAVDWIKSLKNHSKRVNSEIKVAQGMAGNELKQIKNQDIKTSIMLIKNGLKLSIQLLETDRGQILSRIAEGIIPLDEDLDNLLKATEYRINKAEDILAID